MKKVKCRYCKSEKTIKRGKSSTRNRGLQQRWKCKECGRTFIEDNGFWKMKSKPKIVTMSVDMYLSNLSSRKMRNQLKRHMETKISHVSILDWVRKYIMKVQKLARKMKPKLEGRFYADETEIDCQGRKDIFWLCIDWDTRFLNADLYTTCRRIKQGIKFMRKIKNSLSKPRYIQTDALGLYPKAFKRVFYSNKNKNGTEHRINNVRKTKRHNVRIESVFMKIKDRVQDFRGFKALWSAPILMTGWCYSIIS